MKLLITKCPADTGCLGRSSLAASASDLNVGCLNLEASRYAGLVRKSRNQSPASPSRVQPTEWAPPPPTPPPYQVFSQSVSVTARLATDGTFRGKRPC